MASFCSTSTSPGVASTRIDQGSTSERCISGAGTPLPMRSANTLWIKLPYCSCSLSSSFTSFWTSTCQCLLGHVSKFFSLLYDQAKGFLPLTVTGAISPHNHFDFERELVARE